MIGVLFDLDGTLLDTLEDLADAVNWALRSLSCPERTLSQVRSFLGNGAARLMAQAVPEGVDSAPALAAFQSYYADHCQIKTGAYPGIMEALEEIQKNYPVAIVSNKPDGAVKTLCRQYFPGIYAQGETADIPRKPAPDMVKAAMAAIGVSSCIYVGDSEVDVLTAKNAGVPCLSVLWGFRDKREIEAAGGKHFCNAPADLPNLLEGIAQRLPFPRAALCGKNLRF